MYNVSDLFVINNNLIHTTQSDFVASNVFYTTTSWQNIRGKNKNH